MRLALKSTSLLFLCAATLRGAASLELDYTPTPALPGFTTITVTAVADDPDDEITAFDLVATGSFNQVASFGVSTVFQDANVAFDFFDAEVAQDTQFLFSSSEVATLGAPPQESSNQISGVLVLRDRSNRVPLVQLVAEVEFVEEFDAAYFVGDFGIDGIVSTDSFRRTRLTFHQSLAGAFTREQYERYVTQPVPEPGAGTLAALGTAGVVVTRRFRRLHGA